MEKQKIRKENVPERKMLEAVVQEEQLFELGDQKTKEVIVVDNDDKDDSGRESDSSDNTSDDKYSSNNLLRSVKSKNVSKTVLTYSYWTHYI